MHFLEARMDASFGTTPLAMGELFNTQHEYVPLIKDRLIDFIRIHISQVGGLTMARKVAAFCGLGNPRAFWKTLEELGLDVVYRWPFDDHHAYKPSELTRLAEQARLSGADALVTTDAVRQACTAQGGTFVMP